MSARPEHRGRKPQMAAALRKAFELWERDADEMFVGDRLNQISVAKRDHYPVVMRLFDHFGDHHQREGHPVMEAMRQAEKQGTEGGDPDAIPLLDAIAALPDGQRGTLFTLMDLACAFAAAEGMALGAAYVQEDAHGHFQRQRTRPRR